MDPLVSIVGFAVFAVVLAVGIILFRSARKNVAASSTALVPSDIIKEYDKTRSALPLKTEPTKPPETVSDAASQASYLKVGRSLADWVKERREGKTPQKAEEKIAA